jgi:hypothetical protein
MKPDRSKLNELKRIAQQTGRDADIAAYQREKRRVEPQTVEGKIAALEEQAQACISAIDRAKELGLTDEQRAQESLLRWTRERIQRIANDYRVNNPPPRN